MLRHPRAERPVSIEPGFENGNSSGGPKIQAGRNAERPVFLQTADRSDNVFPVEASSKDESSLYFHL